MPRSKSKSSSTAGTLREISQLLADAGPLMSAFNEKLAASGMVPPAPGRPRETFADASACACARCRKRNGTRVDDPCELKEELTEWLESTDWEGEQTPAQLADALTAWTQRSETAKLAALLDGMAARWPHVSELAGKLVLPAAQCGHVAVIMLLHEYEASMEEPDLDKGGSPLMHAANCGHAAAVTALIEPGAQCGANVDAVDYNQQTALMIAIFSDRANAAEALLKGGADIEAVDDRRRTALCIAAKYGALDCINVLNEFGANHFHRDEQSLTALEIAEQSVRPEAAAQLKRMQQRQRLREKRDEKLKSQSTAAAGDSLTEEQLADRSRSAAVAAEELLQQEEEEAARAASRRAAKARKKKAKNKGAAEAEVDPERLEADSKEATTSPTTPQTHQQQQQQRQQRQASASSPQAANSSSRPPTSAGSTAQRQANGIPPRKGSPTPHSSIPGGTSLSQGPVGLTGSKGVSHGQQGDSIGDGDAWVAVEQSPKDAAAEVEAARLGELRESWDQLLAEAAQCRDAGEHPTLLARIESLSTEVAAAGISLKYSKKVVAKLQKACVAREALESALESNPPNLAALEAALEAARGARGLLDEQLLLKAEARQQQAMQAAEAHRWDGLLNQLHISPEASAAVVSAGKAAFQHEQTPVPAIGPHSGAANSMAAHQGMHAGMGMANGSVHLPVSGPGFPHSTGVAPLMGVLQHPTFAGSYGWSQPPGVVHRRVASPAPPAGMSPPPPPLSQLLPPPMAAFLPSPASEMLSPPESAFLPPPSAAPMPTSWSSGHYGVQGGGNAFGSSNAFSGSGHGGFTHSSGSGGGGYSNGSLFGGGNAFSPRQSPAASATSQPALYTPFGGVGSAFGTVALKSLSQTQPQHHVHTSFGVRGPQPASTLPPDPSGSDTECVICMYMPRNTVCLPCGHTAMCSKCAAAVQNMKPGHSTGSRCPVCRTPIERVMSMS